MFLYFLIILFKKKLLLRAFLNFSPWNTEVITKALALTVEFGDGPTLEMAKQWTGKNLGIRGL